MKFAEFNKFNGSNIQEVVSYLTNGLLRGLRDLRVGLGRLSFEDNFDSFTWTGEILAGETEAIQNRLKSLPSAWLVARGNNNALTESSEAWTQNVVFIENTAGAAFNGTIIFFK